METIQVRNRPRVVPLYPFSPVCSGMYKPSFKSETAVSVRFAKAQF